MGAANSCSYADIAIEDIDKTVIDVSNFLELHYFGGYRDDCFSIWKDAIKRLYDFLNSSEFCFPLNLIHYGNRWKLTMLPRYDDYKVWI